MPRIDRNARARLLFHAEALDRRTRLPGQHGGVLKRTGLAVLKALLFGFANVATGRCDPSFDTLARARRGGPFDRRGGPAAARGGRVAGPGPAAGRDDTVLQRLPLPRCRDSPKLQRKWQVRIPAGNHYHQKT
jgi:hypothetical protein